MTIRETQQKYKATEIDILLEHALQKPKEFLYLEPNYKLTALELAKVRKTIKQRRKGEPIAYILGYKYFYGLKFKVNRYVLIPRPETEWLVDTALELVKDKRLKIKDILDVGTGSGCIPISIAKYTKNKLNIIAADISKPALAVARTNAKTHEVKIKFIQSDLFKNVKGRFNMITANLPYVPLSRYKKLVKDLRYEPRAAITESTNVWKLYQKFFAQLPKYLKPGGIAVLEIDEDSGEMLQFYITQTIPNAMSTFYRDSRGLLRYLTVRV